MAGERSVVKLSFIKSVTSEPEGASLSSLRGRPCVHEHASITFRVRHPTSCTAVEHFNCRRDLSISLIYCRSHTCTPAAAPLVKDGVVSQKRRSPSISATQWCWDQVSARQTFSMYSTALKSVKKRQRMWLCGFELDAVQADRGGNRPGGAKLGGPYCHRL